MKPPARLNPPPGTPGWYGAWCDVFGVSAHHPEEWPDTVRGLYIAHARARFKLRWRRLLADGDVALIREQSGRAYLVRMVQRELTEAMEGPPMRSPYSGACPCHPRRLGGMAKSEAGRVADPVGIMSPNWRPAPLVQIGPDEYR